MRIVQGADPETFYVSRYGHPGQGATDDQPAIQEALDNIAVSGGGVLKIPPGVYRVDAPIQIGDYTTLEMSPNAVIRRNFTGLGSHNATIRNKTQSLGGNTHITIRGGRIEAADSANEGKHLALRGVLHSQVRDVRIGQVYGDWATNFSGQYITVEGMHINTGVDSNNQDGIHITGGRFISVSNCVINSGDDCLSFTQDENAFEPLEDVVVSNCSVFGSGASCIKLDCNTGTVTTGIHRISVSNIVGKGGDGAGVPIALRDETASGIVTDITLDNVMLDCSENTGHGCTVDEIIRPSLRNVVIDQANGRSIYVTNCQDAVIDHCKALNPRGAGNPAISADTCPNIEFIGCLTEGSTGAGIIVENTAIARVLNNQDRNSTGNDFDVDDTENSSITSTGNVAV